MAELNAIDLAARIHEYEAAGQPLTSVRLSRLTGLPLKTVRTMLKLLVRNGFVRSTRGKRALYFIVFVGQNDAAGDTLDLLDEQGRRHHLVGLVRGDLAFLLRCGWSLPRSL